MKSLEIVNERIESTLKAENKLKMELQLCFYKDEASCIKQDLEVLEIIRKKRVNIGRFKACCYISSTPHQLMKTYNRDCNYIDNELSIDEVIKLKQWLEDNENE